ncbi:MAG: efflux RND transporter periplasmic adaptor subunit, partial [Magnetococcales bacterium]|nr:efflux RND transporter periplasmic adaptor subunit [Magnetococcales bacterium]
MMFPQWAVGDGGYDDVPVTTVHHQSASELEGGAVPVLKSRCLLEPVQETVLSSEIPGRINKLPLREGDRFKKGALLVGFDCSVYRAQLALVSAELKGSRKTLKNARQLAKLNSVGALEVELAAVDVEKARARVHSAGVQVRQCRIVAPFAGRVASRLVHQHERVQMGKPLLEIIDDRLLEIHMVAPSKWLNWIKVDQPFAVQLDETGRRYKAKISKLG